MPFTFSHPAAVLPFTFLPKKWVSLTGLIVGSLTPDFEYFIRMRTQSSYSHDLGGLLWFDLPLGFGIAIIFHNVVRNPLFENLPVFLKERLLVFESCDWNQYVRANWPVVGISILIGACSHIFWDGFTHEYGAFVKMIPSLAGTVHFFGIKFPIYRVLQHLSTLIGGALVIFSILHLPKYTVDNDDIDFKYWLMFLLGGAVIASTVIMIRSDRYFGNIIVTGISAMLISIVLTSLLISRRK